MSAFVETEPDVAVKAALAGVDVALQRLGAATQGDLAAAECELALGRVEQQQRRLAAIRLRVLAAADRSSVAHDAGFSGTEAWAARRTTSSRASAAKDVALAGDLESGHDATARALDEGLVSPDHAAVIVAATDQLPEEVSADQRDTVEASLVAAAQTLDPQQLRRRARRILEEVEPDTTKVDDHEDQQVRDEEEAARARCSFSLHDNGDGTTTGHFTIPTLAAAMLRKILEAMTAPRRMRGDATGPVSPDWRHRRGLAFAELLEHLPTDHLHPKTAAAVVVTIDHHQLQAALKAAGLDTGDTISAGEARRLACGAGLIPAVLGGRSVALDLGREARLFSEAQRLALGLRHQSCAADGCERPYAWCELHHRQPWASGGRTDLRDAVPLCHWHHQRIHDRGFEHAFLPDGSVRFWRRT